MNDKKHKALGHRRSVRTRQESQRTIPAPWTRTTAAHRCPVCRHAGCLVSSLTTPAAVVCARIKSEQPIGTAGYLHELRDGPTWAPWRVTLARLAQYTRQSPTPDVAWGTMKTPRPHPSATRRATPKLQSKNP